MKIILQLFLLSSISPLATNALIFSTVIPSLWNISFLWIFPKALSKSGVDFLDELLLLLGFGQFTGYLSDSRSCSILFSLPLRLLRLRVLSTVTGEITTDVFSSSSSQEEGIGQSIPSYSPIASSSLSELLSTAFPLVTQLGVLSSTVVSCDI